jgi:hypothetical protein
MPRALINSRPGQAGLYALAARAAFGAGGALVLLRARPGGGAAPALEYMTE